MALTGHSVNEVFEKFRNLTLEKPLSVVKPTVGLCTDTANIQSNFAVAKPLVYQDFGCMPRIMETVQFTNGSVLEYQMSPIDFKEDFGDMLGKYTFARACPILIFSVSSDWTSTGLIAFEWTPYSQYVERNIIQTSEAVTYDLSTFQQVPEIQKHSYRLGQNTVFAFALPWIHEDAAFKLTAGQGVQPQGNSRYWPRVRVYELVSMQFPPSIDKSISIDIYRGWYDVAFGGFIS